MRYNKNFLMDLQLFNDGEQPEENKPDINAEDTAAAEDDKKPDTKTFTQDELDDILKRRLDRERSKMKEQIEQERREAERLAKLSEQEKAKELEKKRQQELEEREKSLQRRELLLDTADILKERNLPKSFADMMLAEDAEKTMERINAFEKAFRQEVEAAVSDRLKGGHKPTGSSTPKSKAEELQEKLTTAKTQKERIKTQIELSKIKEQE